MAQGYSLHIGLNLLDPNHYNGWDGELNACEFDANDMAKIANINGYKSEKIITSNATRTVIVDKIKSYANKLNKGDILWVTYSGHGGQVPDQNSDEQDAEDETWCLYDGQLIDDELRNLWALFKEGVRILVISDSCHSGSILKAARMTVIKNQLGFSAKNLPSEIASSTYFEHKDFYDQILEEHKVLNEIKASVKLISGCQDNQYSYDGTFNGEFTGQLKKVWNGGKFDGNYSKFHKKIVQKLPDYQTPNYLNIGVNSEEFNSQKPFTI